MVNGLGEGMWVGHGFWVGRGALVWVGTRGVCRRFTLGRVSWEGLRG